MFSATSGLRCIASTADAAKPVAQQTPAAASLASRVKSATVGLGHKTANLACVLFSITHKHAVSFYTTHTRATKIGGALMIASAILYAGHKYCPSMDEVLIKSLRVLLSSDFSAPILSQCVT